MESKAEHKPSCDCIEQFITMLREKKGLTAEDSISFDEQNIFGGDLISRISIETNLMTSTGKPRKKKESICIAHHYCAFCGEPYEDIKQKQLEARESVEV